MNSTRNKKCGKYSSDTCGMSHMICGRHSAALVGGTDTQNFWCDMREIFYCRCSSGTHKYLLLR